MCTILRCRRLADQKKNMAVSPDRFQPARVDALRVPPHSIDAEQAVLGGLMLDVNAWERIADKITEDDFYRKDHRLIYRAIGELSNKNLPCDAVTLADWFESNKLTELVGGASYVIELANATPSAANITAYAEIVREKSVLRQLIEAGTQITGDGFQPEGRSTQEILEGAEQKVFAIAEAGARGKKGFTPMRSAVKEAFQILHHRYENQGQVTGLPTGFADLDDMLAGLQPSDLIILAARPSMGKCLAYNAELVADDGSIATMEDLFRRRDSKVATLRDDMKFDRVAPSAYVDDGVKPVFEVTTRLGRKIETTWVHPFLTPRGWRKLEELLPGDAIAVPRSLPVFGDAEMRECEVALLAYLIGDGGLTGATPQFTNTNPRVAEDFAAAVDAFGGLRLTRSELRPAAAPSWRVVGDTAAAAAGREVFPTQLCDAVAAARRPQRAIAAAVGVSPSSLTHWMRGRSVPAMETRRHPCEVLGIAAESLGGEDARRGPNPLTRWLTSLGLMGQSSHAKAIPAPVFTLRRERLALFLNRLFATDGWACVLASGQAQLGYASVNEKLARQVQHLLLRFGVIAKLRRRWVKYREARRVSWQIDITDARSIETFADEIGIFGKEAALARACTAVRARRYQSNIDHVPVEVWERIAAAKGSMSWAELARRTGSNETNSHVGKRAISRDRLARIAMVLADAELAELAHSDVVWDRIASIEAVGEKQVYDFTIDHTHNFVANDICVHNTALAVNMAEHAAIKSKKAVAIFSMEMSASQLAFRLISSLGRINQQHLRTGDIQEEEWPRVTSAITLLSDAKIFIDDTPALSPGELRARARRLKREHDLGLIVIDYLQLMQVPGNKENRATEISEISRGLKALAKELNVPVIALSQLNRSLEQRTDKRPMMSDLRESGAIEQDADVILFIYRDEYYNPDSADKGQAEVIIGKQRNGPTGSVKLTFLGQYTKFENFAADSYSSYE
jgi:replicative DNA helicase